MKWAAALAAMGLLGGCGSTGVTVPQHPPGFARCEPTRPVNVEDLRKAGPPGCNMTGLTVRFPDGTHAKIGAIGATNSWSYDAKPGEAEIPTHYTMVNWGTPGIAVAELNRGGWINDIWANSTKASDLLFELLRKEGVQVDEPH